MIRPILKHGLMLAVPPVVVAVTLVALHSVWWTFLGYHILICLGIPLASGETPTSLGLRRGVRAGVLAGVGLGSALFLGTWTAFLLLGDRLLGEASVRAGLESWGVSTGNLVPVALFMMLVNGVAEEIYWRGFVQPRILRDHRQGAVAVTAMAYASYHGVTLLALTGSRLPAAALLLLVFGAGCLWGWLRERYTSLWPALLGHVGAGVGYTAVFLSLWHPT